MSQVIKLSKEASDALEQELRRRVRQTGDYRLTKKDLASELILRSLREVDA